MQLPTSPGPAWSLRCSVHRSADSSQLMRAGAGSFLNVPLGLIGVVLAALLIRNSRAESNRPFDLIGFVACALSCSTLMYALELVGQQPTPWFQFMLLLAVSLITGLVMLFHSKRHETPLIDLSSLSIRTFAVTIWGGSFFRIAISVIPFLLPFCSRSD